AFESKPALPELVHLVPAHVSGWRKAQPHDRNSERKSVAGSGTAVVALSEVTPNPASQSARSPALKGSGDWHFIAGPFGNGGESRELLAAFLFFDSESKRLTDR